MSGADVQISVANLTQMDRHQSDTHRSPIVHQVQNAQISREVTARRVAMPVEPDATEEKNVDPEKRSYLTSEQKKKKKKGKKKENRKRKPIRSTNSGYIVDINA